MFWLWTYCLKDYNSIQTYHSSTETQAEKTFNSNLKNQILSTPPSKMTDEYAICQLCPGELRASKWSITKCCDVVAHHEHFVEAARNSTLISKWSMVSRNGVHLDRIPLSCPGCYSTITLWRKVSGRSSNLMAYSGGTSITSLALPGAFLGAKAPL